MADEHWNPDVITDSEDEEYPASSAGESSGGEDPPSVEIFGFIPGQTVCFRPGAGLVASAEPVAEIVPDNILEAAAGTVAVVEAAAAVESDRGVDCDGLGREEVAGAAVFHKNGSYEEGGQLFDSVGRPVVDLTDPAASEAGAAWDDRLYRHDDEYSSLSEDEPEPEDDIPLSELSMYQMHADLGMIDPDNVLKRRLRRRRRNAQAPDRLGVQATERELRRTLGSRFNEKRPKFNSGPDHKQTVRLSYHDFLALCANDKESPDQLEQQEIADRYARKRARRDGLAGDVEPEDGENTLTRSTMEEDMAEFEAAAEQQRRKKARRE